MQSAAPHAHPNMQSPGVHQLPIPMHAAMPMQMANPGVQQPQPSPSHPSRQLYGQSNMVYAGPAVYVQPVVTPQPMYGQQPQTFQNWSPQLQQYGGPMPPGPIPSRPPGPVPPQQRQSRALKITDPQTGEELKLGENHLVTSLQMTPESCGWSGGFNAVLLYSNVNNCETMSELMLRDMRWFAGHSRFL